MRWGTFLVAAAAAQLAMAPSVRAQVRLTGVAGGDAYGVGVMSYRDIPFRTVVRQKYDFSCGSAALATLLKFHYGRSIDEAEVFKAMYDAGDQPKIRVAGFSLLDMKRFLAGAGLKADGYRMSVEALGERGVPAIALLTLGRYRHFVVVKGVRAGEVLVGDPAAGLKSYPVAEFEKASNGVFFLIHDGAQADAFNRPSEWRPFAQAPLNDRLGDEALQRFTIALPPLFQVSSVLDVSVGR